MLVRFASVDRCLPAEVLIQKDSDPENVQRAETSSEEESPYCEELKMAAWTDSKTPLASHYGLGLAVLPSEIGSAECLIQNKEASYVLHLHSEDSVVKQSPSLELTPSAHKVFGGKLVRGQKFQHRKKQRKSPKSWCFKYKTEKGMRKGLCEVHEINGNDFHVWHNWKQRFLYVYKLEHLQELRHDQEQRQNIFACLLLIFMIEERSYELALIDGKNNLSWLKVDGVICLWTCIVKTKARKNKNQDQREIFSNTMATKYREGELLKISENSLISSQSNKECEFWGLAHFLFENKVKPRFVVSLFGEAYIEVAHTRLTTLLPWLLYTLRHIHYRWKKQRKIKSRNSMYKHHKRAQEQSLRQHELQNLFLGCLLVSFTSGGYSHHIITGENKLMAWSLKGLRSRNGNVMLVLLPATRDEAVYVLRCITWIFLIVDPYSKRDLLVDLAFLLSLQNALRSEHNRAVKMCMQLHNVLLRLRRSAMKFDDVLAARGEDS